MRANRAKLVVISLGLTVGLLGLVVVSQQAFAVNDNQTRTEAILLSPTSKQYKLDAGTLQRDSFKIVNDGQTAFNFVVYARPYSVTDESYTPDFTSTVQNADAYKWVQFDKSSYFIEPGKSVDVGYTIRVPATAAPGGHYGVLFAETQPSASIEGTAIIRKKRVGAIVYATVNGATVIDGTFVGAKVSPFQFRAPLEVRQRVKNSGNTDFEATSNVRVADIFGGLKFRSDKKVTILPATTREIVNDWQDPAWLGLYRVDTSIAFNDTNKTSTHYVLLVPLWVYITLGLLIGMRALYAVVWRRKHKK